MQRLKRYQLLLYFLIYFSSYIVVPYRYYTSYCVLLRRWGKLIFLRYWSIFFLQRSITARPLVCAVHWKWTNGSAVELHSLWLEIPPKPERMGWASGYIKRASAKALQISSPSATTTRSLLYETRSLCRWTSHRSGSRHLSAWPTRRFSAARSACSSWSMDSLPLSGDSLFWELLYKRANFFGVVANAAPFLLLEQGSPASRWQTRRVCFMLGRRPRWTSTHRDGMSPQQWSPLCSPLCARG